MIHGVFGASRARAPLEDEDDVFLSPEELEPLPLGLSDYDAVQVDQVIKELSRMVRGECSLEYEPTELKKLRKCMIARDIDLTLIEAKALHSETHNQNIRMIAAKRKRLRQ